MTGSDIGRLHSPCRALPLERAGGSHPLAGDQPVLPQAAVELGPFGVDVTVERVDMTDDEQIVAVCSRGRARQRVPILDLPLPSPPPKGADWIKAYRRWARGRL